MFKNKPIRIITSVLVSLVIASYCYGEGLVDFGIFSGFNTRTMKDKTNINIKSGFEVRIADRFLIMPHFIYNFPNERSSVSDEKFIVMDFGDVDLQFPRFEFGLSLGYKYEFVQLFSPFITAGLTYGKYESPHMIGYNIFGIPTGEYWYENRISGIPVVIGNYFEMTDRLSIKLDFQSTYYTGTNVIMKDRETHSTFSFGGGASIVYMVVK